MRYVSILSLALVFALVPAKGQQIDKGKKNQYVVVPAETILLSIANQPDSPLQFEQAKYLAHIGGGGGPSYQLRNRGTKPIRAFTVASLNTSGTGGSWGLTEAAIMPGQLVPIQSDPDDEIVPLTDELRRKLNLQGTTKAVVVLMVVRVEYKDGTTYDDSPKYKVLQSYFEGMAEKLQSNYHMKSRSPAPQFQD